MATRGATQQNRAGARAANAGRRRRKRHGKRTLHYMLLVLFLLVLAAVLCFTALFKIERVEVLGVDKYLPDDIAAASGVVLEENLLRIDKAAIRENLLEKFPYIRDVEIRRKLPPTVEITVIQAEPVGAILTGGEAVLFDSDGKVLERGLLIVPETVPVVKGIDAAGAQPGEYLGVYTETKAAADLTDEQKARHKEEEDAKAGKAAEIQEQLTMFRYLLAAMEESGFTELTNVDLSNRLNMRITYENRIVLELGSEAQLADKLKMVKFVLETEIGPEETGTLNATEITRNRVRFRVEQPADGTSPPEGSGERDISLEGAGAGGEKISEGSSS